MKKRKMPDWSITKELRMANIPTCIWMVPVAITNSSRKVSYIGLQEINQLHLS